MFLCLFESFLVVLSYASADLSMLAPCSYWSVCLTMLAGATFIH